MRNLWPWMTTAIVGLYLGKEFIDWSWGFWEDEDDEPRPAPLLCAAMEIWGRVSEGCWWLRRRLEAPFFRLRWRFFPPDIPGPIVDADGRTLEEWLLIQVIGIWDLECWYKDEYDWTVKKNWDALLNPRQLSARNRSEAQDKSD